MPAAVCIFPLGQEKESKERLLGWDAGSLVAQGQESTGRAACTRGRAGGRAGQSQALVPHLDLWPACSCGDEDCGLKSTPLWQALSYSSAMLCCTCCKHRHQALHNLEVFWKNKLIYPHVTPTRKVNTL